MARALVKTVANAPMVHARYHTASNQTIPNSTITIINFDVSDWDTGNNVTTGASWKFTATTAAYYKVSAIITYLDNNDGGNLIPSGSTINLFLYKNGVQTSVLWEGNVQASNAANRLGTMGSDTISLVATDFIDIRASHNAGNTQELFGAGAYVYVAIDQLPSVA